MNFATTPTQSSPATQRVDARRVDAAGLPFSLPQTTLEQDLVVARMIARAMDSQFELAGLKFGLDSIIGLVPVVGDAISAAIGLYPIHIARKHKLGKLVILRMLANLGADFVVGSIPVVGDAADVVFKAQLMNIALLEKAAAKRGVALPAV